MPTLCTFDFPSGRGQFHIMQDERTAGLDKDVVVQCITDDGAYIFLRANGSEDYAAVIVDMAREIARLQNLLKAKAG